MLGNPAQRAAYDQSFGNQPGPDAPAPERPAAGRPCGSDVPVIVRRAGRVPEPPLQAGPVRVEVPGTVPAEDDVARLAALAELAVRYLAGDRDWPW